MVARVDRRDEHREVRRRGVSSLNRSNAVDVRRAPASAVSTTALDALPTNSVSTTTLTQPSPQLDPRDRTSSRASLAPQHGRRPQPCGHPAGEVRHRVRSSRSTTGTATSNTSIGTTGSETVPRLSAERAPRPPPEHDAQRDPDDQRDRPRSVDACHANRARHLPTREAQALQQREIAPPTANAGDERVRQLSPTRAARATRRARSGSCAPARTQRCPTAARPTPAP